jgi:hypothetical protein
LAYGCTEILAELDNHGFEDIDQVQKMKFINDAYYEVCSIPYPFLERTSSFALTPGSNILSIPADPDGSVDSIMAVVNNTKGYSLQPQRQDILLKGYSANMSDTGNPMYYYAINGTWYLYVVPSSADTVTVRFTIMPNELTSSSTPIVPIWHRRLITLGALYRAYMMNDDSDIAMVFKKEMQDKMKLVQENLWRQQFDRTDIVYDLNNIDYSPYDYFY